MKIPYLIIGGGLAGTTIATVLSQKNRDFLLLEANSRLGGKIETKLTTDACYEFGPNSFTNQTDEIFQFLEMLGLKEDILEPSPAAHNRYILKKGEIVALPSKPPHIFSTKSLSLRGKLRFLREFFYVPKKKKAEESVRDFFVRHFGTEIADYFADPFVSGVYAGDPTQLSLKEAFPTMAEAETHSKSLLRHLIGQRKTNKATPQTYQLKEGLESIFRRAQEKLGQERIHLQEKVEEVLPNGELLKVRTTRGEYETTCAFVTTPAFVSTQFLREGFSEASQALARIRYAPVVTAHLRLSREENYPFNGFGILLPSVEKRRILGALWNSSIFPALFPDKKHHYLTVYLGGARHPELVSAPETELENLLADELRDLFALQERPELIHLRRHNQAIPQYVIGYGQILQTLEAVQQRHPALRFSGNYMGGISIPRTVTHAMKIAADALNKVPYE